MTPRLLALDLSLTATGWCLDGQTGRITTKLRGIERVDAIVRDVQRLCPGVSLSILEGYSFGSKGRAVFDVAELGGCVRLLLHRLGIPRVDVPPSTLKKWGTGRGNANKIEMVVAARERFGLEGTTDDNECDAFLLWAMARHHYGIPIAKVPKVQAEAADKGAWPLLGRSRA